MALTDEFASAQERVRRFRRTPTNDELLNLYSLYKQATLGDVQGKRPGLIDFKGRAKHDAWSTRAGMSSDAAMQAYIDLVARLADQCG